MSTKLIKEDLLTANFLCIVVVVFNIPPTAIVIWSQGHGLKSHPIDGEARDRTCEPYLTRQVVYPLHHRGSYVLQLICLIDKAK